MTEQVTLCSYKWQSSKHLERWGPSFWQHKALSIHQHKHHRELSIWQDTPWVRMTREAEAQKNIRKRWRKMHYFLGRDGQGNHAGICLELHLAIWSLFRSLMCFLRTAGTNWIADLLKSLGFEGGRVKGFWIIHSLSHLLALPHFLALPSPLVSSCGV